MSASLKKSFADVTRRKGRTLLVVLGIFIGVFGLTALMVTEDTLFSAFAFSVGSQTTQPDILMATDKLDPALLPTLRSVSNVKVIQYETDFDTLWRVKEAPGYVPIRIISYPDIHHIPLSPFELIDGRYPGAGEIVMEYGDVGVQTFNLGEMVTVDTMQGKASLRVVGLARTPGVNPAVSGKAQGYMTDTGLRHLAAFTDITSTNRPRRLQIIAVKVYTITHLDTTAVLLQDVLRSHQVKVLASGFPELSTLPIQQIDGVFKLLLILVTLAVLISAILVFNTVSTLVTEQTWIIGTMKAAGGTGWQMMSGYLISAGLYSCTATLPGLILGIISGSLLASALAQSIPLALGPFTISPGIVLLGLAVGFGVPLLAALVPVWNGTRITVREAISAYGVSTDQGNGPLAGLGRRVTWVPQTAWLGLRSLFRKRWRVAMTLLTLTAAGTSFLVVQTVTSAVSNSVHSVYARFAADVEVDVGGQLTFSQIRTQLSALPNVHRVERYGTSGANTVWGKLVIWGFDPETQMYQYQLMSGRWLRPSDTNVVLISDDFAQRTGLYIGSVLEATNQNGKSASWTVIGTLKQSVDGLGQVGAAVLPVNTLYQFMGTPANVLADTAMRLLIEAQDRSPEAVSQLTFRIGDLASSSVMNGSVGRGGGIVAVFLMKDEELRQARNWLIAYSLLYGLAMIVGVVAILGLANELMVAVLEGRREIGILRAMGASTLQVAQVFWTKGLALGGIAWCLGVLLGLPLAYAFLQVFSQLVIPAAFIVDPLAFVVMLVAILCIATLASIAPSRRAAHMVITDMLRYE